MLATDPTQTFDVVLKVDQGRPDSEPPAPCFTFRFLSAREFRALAAKDKLAESKEVDVDKALDALFSAIRSNLVDWQCVLDREGKPVEFDLEQLDALVTVGEAWELYWAARRQSRLDTPAKNASESQSPTSSGESAAETANPATTSAPTGPQLSSPQSSSAPDATEKDAADVADVEIFD